MTIRAKYLHAIALILFVCGCVVSVIQGPSHVIDVEFYPAFTEGVRGGWLCLFSMDRLMSNDLSLPYAGWPVLQPLLVGILGKVGFAYSIAVVTINAIAMLCCALLARNTFSHYVSEKFLFYITWFVLFSGASWVSINVAFAHGFIPLGFALGFWNLEKTMRAPNKFSGGISVAVGFIVGSCNWACFFIVPAAIICLILMRFLLSKWLWSPKQAISWIVSFTVGLVLSFIVYYLFHKYAEMQISAISAPMSGSGRIAARSIPTLHSFIAASFYSLVRLSVCCTPLIPFLIYSYMRADFKGVTTVTEDKKCRFLFIVCSAILAPLLFIVVFSGEMAPAAHIFHSRLFIWSCASLLAYLIPYLSLNTYFRFLPAACILFFIYSIVGWRIIPSSIVTKKSIQFSEVGPRLPGQINEEVEESKNMNDVLRTIILNSTQWPISNEKRQKFDPIAANDLKNREISASISNIVPQDGVIIVWQKNSAWIPYRLGRDIICGGDEKYTYECIQRILSRVDADRIYVLVPELVEKNELSKYINIERFKFHLFARNAQEGWCLYQLILKDNL